MEHLPDALGGAPGGGRLDLNNLKQPLGEREVQCEQHGPYTSTGMRYFGKREIWTPCPDCEDARMAAERQQAAQEQARVQQERMAHLLSEAAIPRRFIGRTFDTFVAETPVQQRALATAQAFADSFPERLKRGDSLIFLGAPGTGKSHLAASILQAILPEHCGLYTTCAAVIRSVRATWRQGSERTEGQVLAMLAGVPLLVVDEVGVQYGTDSEQNILFDLLDRRYRDMMPTLLLANLRLKRDKPEDTPGLREVVGERIYDRLTETAKIVVFDGESFRVRARQEHLA